MMNQREVINSKCTSVITYGLELYFGQTLWTQNRSTALLMRNNRAIYQKDYYKVSNRRICNEIGFDEPYILCKKAAYRFIHKTIRSQKPPQLYEMLKFNQNHRECSRIGINDAPSKKINKRNLMTQAINLFNRTNPDLKYLSVTCLKGTLKKLGDQILSTN